MDDVYSYHSFCSVFFQPAVYYHLNSELTFIFLMFHGLSSISEAFQSEKDGHTNYWLLTALVKNYQYWYLPWKIKNPQTLDIKEDSELAGCSRAQRPWWRQFQHTQKKAMKPTWTQLYLDNTWLHCYCLACLLSAVRAVFFLSFLLLASFHFLV